MGGEGGIQKNHLKYCVIQWGKTEIHFLISFFSFFKIIKKLFFRHFSYFDAKYLIIVVINGKIKRISINKLFKKKKFIRKDQQEKALKRRVEKKAKKGLKRSLKRG